VYRFAAGHYSATPVTTTMLAQQSLAVDSAGSLYSVYTQNTLYKYVRSSTSPAYSFASTADGTTSSDSPQTVTLENDGNAPLIFAAPTTGNNPGISTGFTIGGTSTCPLLTPGSGTGALASGATCSELVSFSPLAIGAYNGSLIFTDNTMNVAGSTQTTALSGTATIGNKTITFTQPTSPANVGSGATLVATSSSGDPVTFSVTNGTGTASLSGSTISYLTLGTVTVNADSAANSNYNAAPTVSYAVTIQAVPLAKLTVTGYPTSEPSGVAANVTVTAYDGSNNIIPGFTGTVTLTSSDPSATLPAAYTFLPADAGAHVFSVTLNTAGTQSLTATSGSISGSQTSIISTGYVVAVSGGNGKLSKFTEDGTPYNSSGYFSGAFPDTGAAVDGAGDVFSFNFGNGVLVEFNSAGTPLSGSGYTGGGLSFPQQLAVDGAGQVWAVNAGNSTLSVFTNGGVPVTPSTGYAGAYLSSPHSIAIDISGNAWVANQGNNTVVEVLGAAAPAAPPSTALTNGTTGARP
jgi:hypothetical protein